MRTPDDRRYQYRNSRGESMYADQVTPNSQYPRSKSEGNEENDESQDLDGDGDGDGDGDIDNSDTQDLTPKHESDGSSSGGEAMEVASPPAAERPGEQVEGNSVQVDT
jgi:hypothetical protein